MRLSGQRRNKASGHAISPTALKLTPEVDRRASERRSRSLTLFTGRRRGTSSGLSQTGAQKPADELQTHAEKAVGSFLEPFALSKLTVAVHSILGAGYSSPNALQAVDERALKACGLSEDDAERILLATWLQTAGLTQYGRGLVASGCTSRLHLLTMTDERLKAAGILAIGHRRLLQRHMRESDELQRAAEASRKREAERMGKLRGLSGGLSKKDQLIHGSRSSDSRGPGMALGVDLELTRQVIEPVFGPSADGLAHGAMHMPKWDDWASPWRTVSNASLRTTPGALAETHYAAPLDF
jgi:uncharacterized protein YjiS (DUF1127 family)